MNNYYFTFGSGHSLKNGYCMNHNWIRVQASDYMKARQLFIEKFSSVFMERVMGWSNQYTEEDFSPIYFTKGEYLLLIEETDESKTEV